MLADSKIRITGFLGVESQGELEVTARAIERAIEGLKLEKDRTGNYEEFPAFTGRLMGMDFALLGPPPNTSKSRDALGHCELGGSTANRISSVYYDISEHLQMLCDESDQVTTWILK